MNSNTNIERCLVMHTQLDTQFATLLSVLNTVEIQEARVDPSTVFGLYLCVCVCVCVCARARSRLLMLRPPTDSALLQTKFYNTYKHFMLKF